MIFSETRMSDEPPRASRLAELPGFAVQPGEFAVVRLPPASPVPEWAGAAASFCSITRTDDELSVVCPASVVPADARAERGWAMLKRAGPFPFTATGVLASVLAPLARAGISVFAVSTFDTDYVLVKREDLARAIESLEEARRRLAGRTGDPYD